MYEFINPAFLEAMNEIGELGFTKNGDRVTLDGEPRKVGERWRPEIIAEHASEHFRMHLRGELHDHFRTRRHQLAAVAFNAMMEFYFAGLENETRSR